MFPTQMRVPLNRAPPGHHPILDSDCPLQRIQLLGDPLVNIHKAIENGHVWLIYPAKIVIYPWKIVIYPWKMVIYPWKMVIFHSFLSLPEGTSTAMEPWGWFPMSCAMAKHKRGCARTQPMTSAGEKLWDLTSGGRNSWRNLESASHNLE